MLYMKRLAFSIRRDQNVKIFSPKFIITIKMEGLIYIYIRSMECFDVDNKQYSKVISLLLPEVYLYISVLEGNIAHLLFYYSK